MLQIHKFNNSSEIGDIIVHNGNNEDTALNYTRETSDGISRRVLIGQQLSPEMTSCVSMTNTGLAFLVICCLLAGFVAATVICAIVWQFYLKPKYDRRGAGSLAAKERPANHSQGLNKEKTLCEQCMKQTHGQNGHYTQQNSATSNNYAYGYGFNRMKNDPHKVKSRDDSSRIVILEGSTTHGLGFNIYPDSEHKIYVRSPVLVHADQLSHGDRILSAKINFERILYEDALTILNYASPYPMELEIFKSPGSKVNGIVDYDDDEIGSIIDCYLPNIIDRYSTSSNPTIPIGRFKSKSLENLHISSLEKFAYKKCASENDGYISRSMNNQEFFPMDPADPLQPLDQSESSSAIRNGVGHVTYENHVTGENHVIASSNVNLVKSKSEEDFRKFHAKPVIENHHIQFRHFYNPYPNSADSMNDQHQRYHDSNPEYQRYPNPTQRDSGLGDSHTKQDFVNKLQYDKLMYFQDRLVLQQRDLKAMNLMVPDAPKLPENLHINHCSDKL